MFDDTLVAGGSLCDAQVVEHVVRQSPQRIQELIDWGVQFDHPASRLALGARAGTATTASPMPWATPLARKSCA